MSLREGADAVVDEIVKADEMERLFEEARALYPCHKQPDCLEANVFNGHAVCDNCFRRMLYQDPGGFTSQQLDIVGMLYHVMMARVTPPEGPQKAGSGGDQKELDL